MTRPSSQLARDIAERIEAALDSYPDGRLPSRAQLARLYKVSHTTISNAAIILKQKGLIELYAGKSMQRAGIGCKPKIPEKPQSSAARLYKKLKEQIGDGTFRAGQYLPKLDYHMLEEHVTNRTVREAYNRLAGENLAYKAGRHWIVGSRPEWNHPISGTQPPFLLILQCKGTSWSGLYAPRTEAFARTFSAEAARCGMQLVSAYTTLEGAPTRLHLAGRERVLKYIASEKERYLAALLVDRTGEVPDMVSWINFLCAKGKPVVWFDSLDQGLQVHKGAPLYTRCHFAEKPGVSVALDHLEAMGHRKLAYIDINDGQWRLQRRHLVCSDAARRKPPMQVITVSPRQFLWADQSSEAIGGILAKLRLEPEPAQNGVFDSLIGNVVDCRDLLPENEQSQLPAGPIADVVACIRAAGLGRYKLPFKTWNYLGSLYLCHTVRELLRQGVTAILAPCDQDARSFHTWLSMSDIEVPGKLSLLSFDNYQSLHPLLPVSTVDFGFSHLGYAAFHFILGDVPVARDRDGHIGARPFVVNRGSVDVPRRSPG